MKWRAKPPSPREVGRLADPEGVPPENAATVSYVALFGAHHVPKERIIIGTTEDQGTILGMGHHPYGDSWRIRVTHPYTGALLEDVDLVDRTLSTSGNRPAYNGHVVDPRSGRAVTAPRLVTVVSEDPLDAEVLSTAAMVADETEREELRARFHAVIKVFS